MPNPKKLVELLNVRTVENADYIRLGRDHDGGYVLLDDFRKSDYVVSLGIFDDVSFDRAISLSVLGVDCYDNSIDVLPEDVPNSRFFKETISNLSFDSYDVFTDERKHYTNMEKILSRVPEDSDLIAKIDIEEAEWLLFETTTIDQFAKFRQMVIEFHCVDVDPPLDIFEKINKTHQVINVHPNNNSGCFNIDGIMVPAVIEVTYARKSDYVFSDRPSPAHDLNMINNPMRPDILEFF